MCKIVLPKNVGSGFFCKVNITNEDPKIFLFTNNHILDEAFLKKNNSLVIYYKGQEKELKLKDRMKKTKVELDFTIIEMKSEDSIKDYFEIDCYIDSGIEQYFKQDIGILQYPQGNELSFDKGELTEEKGYFVFHSVSTDYGSSGSPIFLIDNLKIIGLHKGGFKDNSSNYGIFIKHILDYLKFGEMILNPILNKNTINEGLFLNNDEVVELCIKCPIDGCMNSNYNSYNLYKHNECEGLMYINNKGEIICSKCKYNKKFHLCKFYCQDSLNHSYPTKDVQRLIACFALLGRLQTSRRKKFLKELLNNLIDECDSED